MKHRWIAGLLISSGLLQGCTPSPAKYPTAVDQMRSSVREAYKSNQCLQCKSLPKSVENALLPNLSLNPLEKNGDQDTRFDVSAKDVPAHAFFLGLFKDSHQNIIVDPKITGTITLELQHVTLPETLVAVRDTYGYDFRRTAYGYEIYPAELETRVFNVNYLNVTRVGSSQTQLNTSELANVIGPNGSGTGNQTGAGNSTGSPNNNNNPGTPNANQSTAGSTIVTTSQSDYWTRLIDGIKALIGIIIPTTTTNNAAASGVTIPSLSVTQNGRSIITNPQAGVVMVTAYPSELRQVAKFLDLSERNINRQVVIEAKILEVQLDDTFQSGIDWNAFANDVKQTGTELTTKEIPRFDSIFSMSLSGFHGSFTSLIKLLQTQGNVQVLSSPRISTVNNQNAVIKVGNDQFFVTGVSTNITPTGTTNTNSSSVSLTPFFSGITLNVTPQISGNGQIILYIHPSISLVEDQTKVIDLGTNGGILALPLAHSTVRESDSIVRVKNGEYILIGGLMSHTMGEKLAETPLLSRIPFLGFLFRDTKQDANKTELVILLRPQITNFKTWQNELCNSARELHDVDRGFHLGGDPEYFGTEAERFEN